MRADMNFSETVANLPGFFGINMQAGETRRRFATSPSENQPQRFLRLLKKGLFLVVLNAPRGLNSKRTASAMAADGRWSCCSAKAR